MSNPTMLSVAVIGLPAKEQNILMSLFKLSSRRERVYQLTTLAANPVPAMLLVDGDDQEAITAWQTLCQQDKAKASLPTVMVSKSKNLPGPQLYHLQRPILVTHVFNVLDSVTIQASTASAPPANLTAAQVVSLSPTASVEMIRDAYGNLARRANTAQHRALVVDDSLLIRQYLQKELGALSIAVDEAESADEAFALLEKKSSYDLIFLDVVLSGMDGYKICKTIKKNKQHKQTPVIMLTGRGSPFDRIRGKLAGCNTYLTKPVKRDVLHSTIQKYLSRGKR